MKKQIKLFMASVVADYVNEFLEVNITLLAEDCAKAFDHDEWLDDPEHIVWDIACDTADTYLKRIK